MKLTPKEYNDDPQSIDQSLAGTATYLSALYGDHNLFEDYKHRFETVATPELRSRYLYSLGSFRDPELIKKALDYVFDGDLRSNELYSIPGSVFNYRPNEELIFRWLMDNFDKYRERVPQEDIAYYPYWAGGCSDERLRIATDFFLLPEHIVVGTDISLKEVTAQVNDCVSLREREGKNVGQYLKQLASVE